MNGYKLIISDANAMYTNINTDHAIDTLCKWFKQHEKDLPGDFKTELILKGMCLHSAIDTISRKTGRPWERM